jgi:prepilin-type N-terminal cleavage/methylation domain-containing protein
VGSLGKRLASSRSVEITGFTLIELLIVMAIIATLSTIGFYQYSSFIERTKVTKAIADIKSHNWSKISMSGMGDIRTN